LFLFLALVGAADFTPAWQPWHQAVMGFLLPQSDLMKYKNIIIGVAGIAILCGGIFLGSTLNNGSKPDPATSNGPATGGTTRKGSSAATANPGASTAPKNNNTSRTRPASAWAKLSEKYGESRTNLSKKVTTDIAKVMTEAMELADMGAEIAGGKSAAEMASSQTVNSLANRLGLTDEQKAKATEIVQKRVAERMNAMKELSAAMNDDPGPMMETILAGDAFSRQKITEDEYKSASQDTLALLRNVSGFGFGGPGGGSQISDPLLAEQLQSMLTPDQQQQLADIVKQAEDKAAQAGPAKLPFQNGNLPAMDLEKLDQAMQSAQKLTGGLRAMMEGFKGLQQLNPPTATE
jgi:hypothetical protein